MAVALNSAAVTKFLFRPIGLVTRIILWVAAAGLVVLSCQEKFLATFSVAMIVIVIGGAFLLAYMLMNRKLVKRFTMEHA
jgi:hypothetical protein